MLKDIYTKYRKKVIIIFIILVIVLAIWFIVLKPFIKFKSNENSVLEAAKRYYEINTRALPTGNRISTITLQKLYEKDLIDKDLTSSYSSKLCDSNNSWVKVKRTNEGYKYYVHLKCGVFSSSGVDSKGPIITLKGLENIEHSRKEKFIDPGIASVIDDKDGNIKISKVKIDDSDLNVNKNGTYEIKYRVKDSFGNETIKIRKVVINQRLGKTVEKDTKKTNGYYKAGKQNNYIMIDGILFSIIGFSDNNVKVVSSDDLAYVDYKNVDRWLNDYFYNKLSESTKKYIVKSKFCNEKITNPNNYIDCRRYSGKKNVGLISVADINNTKEKDVDFLTAIGYEHDVLTGNDYSVLSDNKFKKINKNKLYAINPVLILQKDALISSGDGSIESPYVLSKVKKAKAGTNVSELKVGEYVRYSGIDWRIIPKDEESTQIVMTSNLSTDDDEILTSFGSKKYSVDNSKNIGYRISNIYNKYINTSKLKTTHIKIYDYKNIPSYNEKIKYNEQNAKLAEVSMFDIFAPSTEDIYWFRESVSKKKVYYNFGGANHVDSSLDNIGIRMTGYLIKDMTVISGKGTREDPYKVK